MKLAPVQHILGISGGFHDAAATVLNTQGDIVYAAHAERYSRLKNAADLHEDMFWELAESRSIDHIAYYERPWLKQLRRLRSGEGINWSQLTLAQVLRRQLGGFFSEVPRSCYSHHLSHAAAGFQTSPFDRATVVVIDAIGELDTISVYAAEYNQQGRAEYRRLWSQQYPHSIGLFYSAITARVGLHPMDEEYITMGMSAWGDSRFSQELVRSHVVDSVEDIRFKENLHTGLAPDSFNGISNEDIAAGAQRVVEELIYSVMRRARAFGFSRNLVYQGGVALNCLANRNLSDYFENVWIMPCPGDAGSSLGAAALRYGGPINWRNAYLGTEIPGEYPVDACVRSLLHDRICGVASGRAEFGPRALGNRSLLADPRGPDIKDLVNQIKRRQQYRPFAPAVLEEHATDLFDMPKGYVDTSYMQVIGRCRHPDLYPAIVHVDGTSRVQTVRQDGSGIRRLLEAWYEATGCPMLLNTSLNIRGEPMVNTRADADRFERLYGVVVHS
jgi:carbamoyltransferase